MKWNFASSRTLAIAAWTTIVVLGMAALLFFEYQNRIQPVGGPVSPAKAAWLAIALLIWVALPCLITADARVSRTLRRAFLALLILMLARGVIEGWMLYVTLNWSPWYGIAHDVTCMVALGWFVREAQPATALDRLMRLHVLVTALAFLPEIYFAWYMQSHFHTQGHAPIYFVPDEPAYADVLLVTKTVVLCLTLYLAFFLQRWLHGTAKGHGTHAQ